MLAYNAAREAFGHAPISLAESYHHIQGSLRDSFPILFGDGVERARKIFYDTFAANHLRALRPIEHAEEVLGVLRSRHIPASILSNKSGDFLRKEVDHLGWSHYFGGSIGAGDAEEDKPSPRAVDAALLPIGLKANADIWLVGDAPVDIQCARAAGCTGIFVSGGDMQRHAWDDGTVPQYSISTCKDLLEWL